MQQEKKDNMINMLGEAYSVMHEVLKRESTALDILLELPFAARCNTPERLALANANTFCLLSNPCVKQKFTHCYFDDSNIMHRLRFFDIFPDGDRSVIDYGFACLALIMIQDYMHDMQNDKAEGKYNPIASNVWNYENLKSTLEKKVISNSNCPLTSEIDVARILHTHSWIF